MDSISIKKQAKEFGARICGIGSIDRFADAPKGFSPLDLFPQTQSIITFAKQIPKSLLNLPSLIPYSVSDATALSESHRIAFELSLYIESKGFQAVMVPSEPYTYWDAENLTGKGLVSLKQLAYKCGLGVYGKNHLLYNPEIGNLMKIGAVLTDAVLETDSILELEICKPNCNLCITSCAVGAISTSGVNQLKCRQYAEQKTVKGNSFYGCNTCRKVCPNVSGFAYAKETRIHI